MSDNSAASGAASSMPTLIKNEQNTVNSFSTGFMVAVVAGSIFLLILIIFAIYKYRNRDEGTYTIDETKNCGPFAEIDMPLNGAKSSKKSSSKNRRKGLGNKEWYV